MSKPINPLNISKMILEDVGRMPNSRSSQDEIERYNRHVEEWLIMIGSSLEGAIKYIKKVKNKEQ